MDCYNPNPDLENETLFPFRHCEHLKGARNLIEKGGLRFTRNDNALNRDLGITGFIVVLIERQKLMELEDL